MNNKRPNHKKHAGISMVLPVAGVVVGAAVMAVVSNHKNQQKAQVLLEQVKNRASSYMKTAQEDVNEGKQKIDKTLGVVEDSNQKVAGIWKK